MTVSMTADEVVQAVELAAGIGAFLGVIVLGLLIYLLVRPKRRTSKPPARQPDALEMEEVLRLLDRMEQRLEVLERAVPDDAIEAPRIAAPARLDADADEHLDELLNAGEDVREARRTK